MEWGSFIFIGCWIGTPGPNGFMTLTGRAPERVQTNGEITIGANFMPARSVNFRPELRWDIASRPVFGPATSARLQGHQWTFAFDMLVKF